VNDRLYLPTIYELELFLESTLSALPNQAKITQIYLIRLRYYVLLIESLIIKF